MITQNILLEYLTKGAQSSQGSKQAFLIEKAQPDKFKDTFNQAMDKAQSRSTALTDNNRYHTKQERLGIKQQERERFNTFKEVERNSQKETSALKTESTGKAVESTNEQDEDRDKIDSAKKANVKSKDEVLLNAFANILGMDLNDLTKLLNNMNIDQKDLGSISELSDAVNRISELLGLDSRQKQILGDILNTLNEQLGTLQGKGLINPGDSQNEILKSKQLAPSVIGAKEKGSEENLNPGSTGSQPELEALMAEFKCKLEELTQKFTLNPQGITTELTFQIKKIMEQATKQDLKVKDNVDSVNNTEEPQSTDVSNDKSEQLNVSNLKESETKGNEKQDNKKDDSGGKEAQSDNTSEAQYVVSGDSKATKVFGAQSQDFKTNNNNTPGVNGMVQNQADKSSEPVVVAKVHKEIPVSKNELFNQIIDKAKVVTNGEKSEMVMELKPESLGKLSLKVVTENGIVTAKFVAENQQVKEVIESNMQLLKDSLEKQGLSVQGFSVSVGQQSSGGFKGEGQFNDNRRPTEDKILNVSRGIAVAGNALEGLDRSNPYNWSESSINLTA